MRRRFEHNCLPALSKPNMNLGGKSDRFDFKGKKCGQESINIQEDDQMVFGGRQ